MNNTIIARLALLEQSIAASFNCLTMFSTIFLGTSAPPVVCSKPCQVCSIFCISYATTSIDSLLVPIFKRYVSLTKANAINVDQRCEIADMIVLPNP